MERLERDNYGKNFNPTTFVMVHDFYTRLPDARIYLHSSIKDQNF